MNTNQSDFNVSEFQCGQPDKPERGKPRGYYVSSYQGVRLVSYNRDGQAENTARLRRAEKVADTIFAARANGMGQSFWVTGNSDPVDGYIVGCEGYESRFDDPKYGSVFADCVEKLAYIDSLDDDSRAVCVGSWDDDGTLVLDVSVHIDELTAALDFGKSNGQTAIFDIAGGFDLWL